MSACVNARSVCVRTFPRAPLLNPSAVMEMSSGASTIATMSYWPSVQKVSLTPNACGASACSWQGENLWQPTSCLRASLTKGIRKVNDSPKRTHAFREMAKKCGATVRDTFWTLGQYDMVAIVEAPDDISMTALGLSSGALRNVRTQTLRAFTQADMKTIVGKMVNG